VLSSDTSVNDNSMLASIKVAKMKTIERKLQFQRQILAESTLFHAIKTGPINLLKAFILAVRLVYVPTSCLIFPHGLTGASKANCRFVSDWKTIILGRSYLYHGHLLVCGTYSPSSQPFQISLLSRSPAIYFCQLPILYLP
jgi:hypothetical protein